MQSHSTAEVKSATEDPIVILADRTPRIRTKNKEILLPPKNYSCVLLHLAHEKDWANKGELARYKFGENDKAAHSKLGSLLGSCTNFLETNGLPLFEEDKDRVRWSVKTNLPEIEAVRDPYVRYPESQGELFAPFFQKKWKIIPDAMEAPMDAFKDQWISCGAETARKMYNEGQSEKDQAKMDKATAQLWKFVRMEPSNELSFRWLLWCIMQNGGGCIEIDSAYTMLRRLHKKRYKDEPDKDLYSIYLDYLNRVRGACPLLDCLGEFLCPGKRAGLV